jgi:hypothetical protein
LTAVLFHKLDAKLNTILRWVASVRKGQEQMSKALEDLQAQVAATDSVIAGAVLLIQGFSARLAEAGVDPGKLALLQSDLASSTSELAHAVAANTVADPVAAAPAPVPAPVADPAPVEAPAAV